MTILEIYYAGSKKSPNNINLFCGPVWPAMCKWMLLYLFEPVPTMPCTSPLVTMYYNVYHSVLYCHFHVTKLYWHCCSSLALPSQPCYWTWSWWASSRHRYADAGPSTTAWICLPLSQLTATPSPPATPRAPPCVAAFSWPTWCWRHHCGCWSCCGPAP